MSLLSNLSRSMSIAHSFPSESSLFCVWRYKRICTSALCDETLYFMASRTITPKLINHRISSMIVQKSNLWSHRWCFVDSFSVTISQKKVVLNSRFVTRVVQTLPSLRQASFFLIHHDVKSAVWHGGPIVVLLIKEGSQLYSVRVPECYPEFSVEFRDLNLSWMHTLVERFVGRPWHLNVHRV